MSALLRLAALMLLGVSLLFCAATDAQAAIAFEESDQGVTNGGTSVAATLSGVTTGNLLVAVVGARDNVTINLPGGWSTALNQSGSPSQAIFYKIAGAAEPSSLTVTVSSSTRLGMNLLEFSGIDSSSPLDQTNSNTGTGTALTSGSVTTTQVDELLIAGAVINADTSYDSWLSSFSEPAGADFANGGTPSSKSTYVTAYRIVGPTGSYSTGATAGTIGDWRQQIVTFRAPPPAVATIIGDGTAPPDQEVLPNATNQTVAAFSPYTTSGADTLAALTVTFTGTDVNDVAGSGVKIWQDNGTTPNEWDNGDSAVTNGTASFSGATASFSSLNIPVSTSASQYLITYDIVASPGAGNTLQGAVTAATVTTNDPPTINDTTDATLTVASTCSVVRNTDDTAVGSLRGCITWANGNAGIDTIILPADTYTLTLTGASENANSSGDLDITESLNIVGDGMSTTIINGNATTLGERILHVTAGDVALTDLSLQNDNTAISDTGGGIQNDGTSLSLTRVSVTGNRTSSHGGGIYTAGTLTLIDVELDDNHSTGGTGGGIYNIGATMTWTGVTVSNNTSSGSGSAVRNGGTLNSTNVTISSNSSSDGSAVFNSGTATFTNCTIYGNSSTIAKPMITIGGGSSTTLHNTIVANPGFQNCQQAFTSSGGNLETDGNTCGFTGGTDQNTVSQANLYIDATLKDNGGYTKTHALLAGSYAIDAGITSGAPATDQRGTARGFDGDATPNSPQTGDYDIGAYEHSTPAATTTIGDGNAPISRDVWAGGRFFGVDAFTLQTSSGGDTLTELTVSFSGTDVNDVDANGVMLWRDDGATANQWDSGDTSLGSASFSGSTAGFTGLIEPITTTATQYLVTYNLADTATPGNTLQGSVTAATVSNTLVNNDTVDATLTVESDSVHETSVYKIGYSPGSFEDLFLKQTSSPATDLLTALTLGSDYSDTPGSLTLSRDPDTTVTTVLDNSVVKRVQMTGSLIDNAGDAYGPVTTTVSFYEDRAVLDIDMNITTNPGGTDYLFMTYGQWDDATLDETFWWSSNNSGSYNSANPATTFNSGNQTAPISFQTLFELGATDGLINGTVQNISGYTPAQLKNSDPDSGLVDIAFQKVNPGTGVKHSVVIYSFNTTTSGYDTAITEARQDDSVTPATLDFTLGGGDGSLSGDGFAEERGAYTLSDGDADDHVKFDFQVTTTHYAPVFEISDWHSAAPPVIGVGGLSKNLGIDYNAAVSGTTLYLQYLGNLAADTVFDIPPSGPAVSGTVYTLEGSSPIADGSSVRLLINGVNAGSATTSGGAYSIATAGLNPGDALLVYVDDNNGAANDGTTVTVADGSALGGLDIYVDHLIVRHDNSGSLSNALIGTAKGGYSDPEILCSVSGGNLTVSGASSELYVPATHSFAPGGNVTTTHIKNLGTLSGGSGTLNISSNWTNSGTFTASSSTVNFNGTGQSITGDTSFHHLTKSVASADTLTFAAGSTTTVGGTCTLNGASGNLLSLRSSTPGTQWVFTLSSGAVKAISFVDVQDSDASNSAAALRPIAPASSVDSLNNLSWFLNSPDIGIDNDFSDWCNGSGNEVCIDDEGGSDDWTNPAKLDITRFAVASNTTDTFYILFGFDDTNLPNPSTACVLIDTPTPTLDDNIDKTLCVTVSNSGVDSVDLYDCDDSISGGCGNATPAATSASSGWSNATAGPWNTDTFVEVSLPFADLGFTGSEVILTSMISYASNSFLKSPKDSIFGPDQNYDDRVIYDIGSGGGGTIPGPGTPVIAGNVYSDEGSVSIGSGKTVHLFVNGSSVGTNTTDAGGGYFFSTAVNSGQTLLVYIDNDGSYQGTSASVSDGTNLTDLDIYAAHLITRHDNGGALSNANLSTAKGGSGDTDIIYSVSGSDLTVTGTGTELFVPSNHSFTPGGNVQTVHLKVVGTLNGGSDTITVSGNWDSSGGTFNYATSTVVMTGSGNNLTPLASSGWVNTRFYNVTVDTGASITAQNSWTYDGDLTISGTLNVPEGKTVWSKWGGTSSALIINAAGELAGAGAYWKRTHENVLQATIDGTVSIADFTYTVWWTDVNTPVLIPAVSYGGNLNIERATSNASDYAVLSGTGPLTVGGNLSIIAASGRDLDDAWTTLRNTDNDLAISIDGDLILGDATQQSTATLMTGNATITIAGNVTINDDLGNDGVTSIDASDGTPAINVAGNWTNNDSFTAGTSTVTFYGTGQSITGDTGFHHLTKSVATADTLTFAAGSTTTVGGTCTLQGADSNLLSLRSATPGTRWNLTLPAGAAKAISYVDVKDSDASGSDAGLLVVNPANSASSGNNLSWFLPLLTVTKTASAGTANPGAVITYTVLVSNTGAGEATDVVLDDHLSPYTAWSLDAFGAATPFEFTDGAPSSALTLGAASYSDDDGGSYTYTPTSTGGGAPVGYDGNVSNWKIPMTGTMDSGGSFTLKYKVRVE